MKPSWIRFDARTLQKAVDGLRSPFRSPRDAGDCELRRATIGTITGVIKIFPPNEIMECHDPQIRSRLFGSPNPPILSFGPITFTRDNTALGRLTVRRTIAFVGGDFRVLLRFNLTSPFFTSMVHDSSVILSFIS